MPHPRLNGCQSLEGREKRPLLDGRRNATVDQVRSEKVPDHVFLEDDGGHFEALLGWLGVGITHDDVVCFREECQVGRAVGCGECEDRRMLRAGRADRRRNAEVTRPDTSRPCLFENPAGGEAVALMLLTEIRRRWTVEMMLLRSSRPFFRNPLFALTIVLCERRP